MSPPIVLSIVLLILLPIVWFLSMHLIAAAGGWRDLARVYRADGPIAGAREWRNRGGRFGAATNYNGCLNVAANATGMQLSLWRLFSVAHPPLFIPWSDIRTEPVRGLFFESVRFSFSRATATLLLRRALAEEILNVGPSPLARATRP